MSKRGALWGLVTILLLGLILRSYQVTARSLWFDEAFSWRMVQFPIPELLSRDAADVHPPLYYLLLKTWATVFGSALLSLRAFSITAAGATIAAGYLFSAYAWRSRQAGLTTALLLAVAGFQIQFAWEARMYTLGTTLALLSAWCLLHALRAKPQRLGWWLAYGVAATAFLYTHYYAIFSLAAEVIFIIGYCLIATRGRVGEILQWRLFWYAAAAGVVIMLLFLPWLPTFIRQNGQVQAAFWIPPIERWSVPDTFYRMWWPTIDVAHTGWFNRLWAFTPLVLNAVGISALLLFARSRKGIQDATWFVVVCSVVPFILSLGLSVVGQSLYQDRFFVFAHVFLLVMIGQVITSLPFKKVSGALLAVFVISFLYADVRYWLTLDIPHKPGARAAAAALFTEQQPDEAVLVSSPFVFFAIDHYGTENYGRPHVTHLYNESGDIIHFAGGPILTPADSVDATFWQQYRGTTLWVVDTTGFGGQPLSVPAPWHAQTHTSWPEVHGYQGEVSLTRYTRPR